MLKCLHWQSIENNDVIFHFLMKIALQRINHESIKKTMQANYRQHMETIRYGWEVLPITICVCQSSL